jgi:cation diffusion facilitator CzcD-associated flavoprotein CzcO
VGAWPSLRSKSTTPVHVVIIGGGFGGICAAAKCGAAGIPYTVYERHDSIGGTWALNRYPGAACDIISHLYSFSFAVNAAWTRKWSDHAVRRLRAC